jgi:hypothetical protein
MPYRKNAAQSEVGIINFEIPFVSGSAFLPPELSRPTSESVFAKGDAARSKIKDALSKKWEVPKIVTNIASASYDTLQFIQSTNSLTQYLSNANDIAGIKNLLTVGMPSFVRNSGLLSDGYVGDLWQSISEGLGAGQGISELIELTKFGGELSLSLSDITNAVLRTQDELGNFTIPLWPETTSHRKSRNKNRLTIANTHRMCALMCAYEQAAGKTYKTDTEIEETRTMLEDAANRLLNTDTDNADVIQADSAVRDAFTEMRLAALDVLDQKAQTAFSLTTVTRNVNVLAFVEAYNLYAEDFKTPDDVTNMGIELRNLNPLQAADKMKNTITVFQQ